MSTQQTQEFETLPMMALRSSPGEILDNVSKNKKSYLIERNGQPKACLVPVSVFLPDIPQDRIIKEINDLSELGLKPWQISISNTNEMVFKFKEVVDQIEYTIIITLPHKYPNTAPTVIIPQIKDKPPHLWTDNSLCIYGAMTTWNPGKHSLMSTLELSKKWLDKYTSWKNSRAWPE